MRTKNRISFIFFWIPACAGMGLFLLQDMAHADEYKPGTIGYLYESCASVLEKSRNPQEFLSTYCGAFLEGYGAGLMAIGPIALKDPDQKDPCAIPKAREYGRINGRFCKNLPAYPDIKTQPAYVALAALDIITRWLDFPRAKKQRAALLKKPVKEVNAMLRPGKFCDSLAKDGPPKSPLPLVNEKLLKTRWVDIVRATSVPLKDEIDQCQSDLAEEDFLQTSCAAKIAGFITALNATSYLQQRKPFKGACGKEITRLYDSINLPKKMCVSDRTPPVDIAKVFLENESIWQKKAFSAPAAASAYLPVYYGFMCRERSE